MLPGRALNHKSKEIREAEEEALQHSIHVAKERYLQSKQLKPQTLTQTYAQEENLFPADFRKELEKDRNDVKDIIKEKQEKRFDEWMHFLSLFVAHVHS